MISIRSSALSIADQATHGVTPRWWVLPSLAVAAYIGVFLYFSPLLLQDYPNHLARAVVMADLLFHHGLRFGQTFAYHFLIAPYVLADWLLAAIVQLLGVAAATRLWAVLVFLSLPGALYAYLRATQASTTTILMLLVLSLYLSTDTFFVLGFLSFRLAVATVLLTLAVAEPLSRRWSNSRYAALVGVVLLGYLTHLAALMFVAIALGTRSLIRLARGFSSLGREILLLLPVGCAVLWHFAIAAGYRQSTDQTAEVFVWGSFVTKAAGLLWGFWGYESRWQALIVMLFAAWLLVVGAGALGSLRSDTAREKPVLAEPAILEPLGIALAFLCVYIVLPSSYSEASFVDVRAAALFWLFLVVGLARLHELSAPAISRSTAAAFGLVFVLAILNLAYLGKQFGDDRRWLTQYRAVAARVPENSRVLPVYTAARRGVVRSPLHAAAYVVTDRGAVIPYLFSGDRGDPMKYFRYLNRAYAPDEDWYGAHQAVDWKEVASAYSYLLVMKPFDATRIPVTGRAVAENSVAVLLAIR